MSVKVMHFLGAVTAILFAYFSLPLILQAAETLDENSCETQTIISIGPITYSREVCSD